MTSKAAYEMAKRNYAQVMASNVTPIRQPKMRTPEEITAQLEARYAELEREAKSPQRMFPCKECRWFKLGDYTQNTCVNALVIGFGREGHGIYGGPPALCGPEKALWEPHLTRWQRFIEWLGKFWGFN